MRCRIDAVSRPSLFAKRLQELLDIHKTQLLQLALTNMTEKQIRIPRGCVDSCW
jgi:hypothetical protein